jgi:ribose 5-phosphate isomerase B
MLIYIGSDHRGFRLKQELHAYLKEKGYPLFDQGPADYDVNDDYPDIAAQIATEVAESPADKRGIIICGSGEGVLIVANKFRGVRAALGDTAEQAAASRNDDDTNVLAIAADFTPLDVAKAIVQKWLDTQFSGEERHLRRLKKIADIEAAHFQ